MGPMAGLYGCTKSFPQPGFDPPDRPPHSESLYRLSYPGPSRSYNGSVNSAPSQLYLADIHFSSPNNHTPGGKRSEGKNILSWPTFPLNFFRILLKFSFLHFSLPLFYFSCSLNITGAKRHSIPSESIYISVLTDQKRNAVST